ncbi:asparagine synthase-related protein [Streptomyces sp. TRM 70351]|uniref:asparagine synthase-related protein n=1 Tax=Streptomyces sp. TRM 70351 TaxID=3116552 RepID=UPI002E7B7C87|nr:asparagine synthase-related protein [Streptomyces sp. TRM 70351]MEE1929770.1 asparagine synthase-related protein [Streptomyces sp. TRM 70351]
MRWLVGWSSTAAGRARFPGGLSGRTLHPVGGQALWSDPDPLWAVGDWRPDEIRVVDAGPEARLAVFGCCGASDEQLRVGLSAARGGALRHLTAWPGSYTAVARVGRRVAVTTDLAGARPVFHTPFAGGTAYATAALTLADLVEAQLDVGHLGALLAAPEAPEALGDSTPYTGVHRVPPGHALILREGGSREIASYEPTAPTVVAALPADADTAVAGVRDALLDAVRVRLAAPRHMPEPDPSAAYGPGVPHGAGDGGHGGYGRDGGYGHDGGYGRDGTVFVPGQAGEYGADEGHGTYDGRDAYGRDAYGHGANGGYGAYGGPSGDGTGHPAGGGHPDGPGYGADGRDPGPVPGMGPDARRGRRGSPAPGVGADLSGGAASATLALLAAGLPGVPGTIVGAPGTAAGQRLLAVTLNDLATAADADRQAELERAHAVAEDPRLQHVVVAAEEEALPYAELADPDAVPLTDEPGPALVTVARSRARLAAGSADHLTGYGARHVLDAHPARLADLLLDRRRRHLLRPAAALAMAENAPRGRSVLVPFAVYRAARRLARTSQRDGVAAAARRLRERDFTAPGTGGDPYGALDASLAALAWCRPGPAARWLTGEALAEVSVRLESAALRTGTGYGERPGVQRARAALARQAADYRVLERAAAVRGQRLHAPFLDNQVVRAARELPEALRVRPGARAAVLRTVLAGAGIHALPPGWGATTHAAHTAAVRAGLRTYADELSGLFAAPLLAEAGLVDARVVRGALSSAVQGDVLPLDGIAELVATELWLRRLFQRRGTSWTGSCAPRSRAVSGGVPPRPVAVGPGAPGDLP